MEFSFRRLFFAIKRLFVTDSKDIYYNALVLLALGAATPLIQRVILNFLDIYVNPHSQNQIEHIKL